MLDISIFLYANFYRVDVSGSDYRVDCPFCRKRTGTSDNKGHLYVNMHERICHCFRCDWKGSWVRLVSEHLDINPAAAYEELRGAPKLEDIANINRHLQRKLERKAYKDAVLPSDFIPLVSQDNSKLAQTARRYLTKRGFGAPYWRDYHLGVAPSLGYRVVIPIEREYWQARSLLSFIEPKYVNPNIPHDDTLFQHASLRLHKEIVITEGAFSAMAVGKHAVALVGKNPTRAKLKRLLSAPVQRYIIALEKGAFTSMSLLADELMLSGREVVLWKYAEGDPADSQPSSIESYGFLAKMTQMLNQF